MLLVCKDHKTVSDMKNCIKCFLVDEEKKAK